MTRWLDPDEAQVWEPYVMATMNLFAMLDAELKETYDITHLDYGLLVNLERQPGGCRMSDLAQMFGVDPSVVTYRVGRMEQRSLAERVRCPTDRRGVLARITPAGRELLAKAAPMHVESVRRLFLDHVDPDAYDALARVFQTVRERQMSG